MEDLDSNIGSSILMRFTDSTRIHHLEIRKMIAATAHGFVPRRMAPTAMAYFEATCSSLNQLSPSSEAHVIEAVVTILSILIPQVSPEILIEKESTNESVSAAVARVLQFDTRNLNDDAAVLGVKCISQLLTVILTNNMDSAWSHVSYLYQLLLGFATTRISHVRKASHVVIAEVMQSMQGTADIVPASEALVNLFERWWLPLLGGNGPSLLSNEAEPMIRESCFCLDVMKRCVVLMPTKFKLTMLNYFKTILELALHRTPVTVRIEWILERFCLHPSAAKGVPPHLLLDLLCLISVSVTKRAVFDREGATTASILKNGVSTVYSSNREICVIKLPLVFDALKVLMRIPADQVDDGHIEEDIYAAAQAFKHLIHTCIDEGLVNQGLDQINTIANSKSEPPQPKELTVIEKLCVTIESLLGYHRTGAHALSMDCAFDVVSTMFDKLGACSCYFMRGTLESLADMHKFADEQFPYRKQATLLLGRLVEEKFGVDDANIRVVLTREELMGLLADYRDLKSKQLAQLSHLKRKAASIEHLSGHCGPSSIMAKVATARAICSTEKTTKKIKL